MSVIGQQGALILGVRHRTDSLERASEEPPDHAGIADPDGNVADSWDTGAKLKGVRMSRTVDSKRDILLFPMKRAHTNDSAAGEPAPWQILQEHYQIGRAHV